MENGPIQQARQLGQSFWLDYIRRDLVENGELERLIATSEIRGVTSNPSIFQQAIGGSELYDAAMRPLAHAGWPADRVFERLAVHDIRGATDLFLPLYEGSGGRDGFVSIEVSPKLANDSVGTLEEARRLWTAVNRPNLMVKIPATAAGVPAIEQAISEGININVTLIFALDRYAEVMQAYLRGLERRAEDGQALNRVASVASFFVSRVDSAVDRQLEQIVREEGPNAPRAAALLGHAAVANAKLAYAQFKAVFDEARFAQLREKGARVQRPLWASTSTKNPAYSDVLYVEQLIGPETVNTLPPKTLEAFRDHGQADPTLERDLSDARAQLEAIEGLGISLQQVTLQLEQQGVQAFADSYDSLMESVDDRSSHMRTELAGLQPRLAPMLEQLEHDRVAARYWRADPTLWPKNGGNLVLDYAERWRSWLAQLESALAPARQINPDRVAWLAPGGVVWPRGWKPEQLTLETLDPAEQRMLARETPVDSTLFVATSPYPRDPALAAILEPVWQRARNRLGDQAAQQFLIMAAEGSDLSRVARERQLPLLPADTDWGGAPLAAELSGGSAADLLEQAERLRAGCAPHQLSVENHGLYLGALLAIAAEAGIRRLGLLSDPEGEPVADWLASRIESAGLGSQLAVIRAVPAESDRAGGQRVLFYLRSSGNLDREIPGWVAANLPVVILPMEAGLGGEAVRWEMGLGVAAHLLGHEPHPPSPDQRTVSRLARALERRRKKSRSDWRKPTMVTAEAAVWWSISDGEALLIQQLADAVVKQLESAVILNLGILRRRSHSISRTLSQLGGGLRARGVDLRVSYGGLPPYSGARAETPPQLSLILDEQPKNDLPVPGRDWTFGELQSHLARTAFEALEADRLAVGLLRFNPPATVNRFLRALLEALG